MFICVENIKDTLFEDIINECREDAEIICYANFDKMQRYTYLKTRFPEHFI